MFTRFYAASIKRQPREYKDKTIGYVVHAHCWALVGQVEGLKLKDAGLAKLVQVCRKYWKDHELWQIYSDFDRRLYTSPMDIYRNPFVLPAIREALDCAKIEHFRQSSCFNNLPLELAISIGQWVCLITDYTEDDIKNTRNLLLVFGWELPEWFWRARLNSHLHLFFELDKTSKIRSPADWQLWLNLVSLVADRSRFVSTGLANRERVLGVMLALEKIYAD